MADLIRPPKNPCPHCRYVGWFPEIMGSGSHVWRCHTSLHVGEISDWPSPSAKNPYALFVYMPGDVFTAYIFQDFLEEYIEQPQSLWDFADAIARVGGPWMKLVKRIRNWQKSQEEAKSS